MTARSRTLPTGPTIAAFVLAAVALTLALGFAMRPRPMTGTVHTALGDLGHRVLVIAAHPDDEVLTAGGAILELAASGEEVRILIATAGDGYYRAAKRLATDTPGPADYRRLGDTRRTESVAAARTLGLDESDVISLGYSDNGVADMWGSSWDSAHPFVGRSGSPTVGYEWAYRPEAVQCGQDLAADLASVIREFKPDTVIFPDTRETHPDHVATGAFTEYALGVTGFSGTRLTAIVHFKRYPYPWAYMPEAGLAPPPQLMGPGAEWLALPLERASSQAKKAAMEEYESQTAVADLAWYMRAFVRRNELFCRRPAPAPAEVAGDDRPIAGTPGTVAVTPAPVVPSARPSPVRVLALRMVRGPRTLWLGLVCAGPMRPDATYGISLRMVGGSAAPERLDVQVRDGKAEVLTLSRDSIEPAGVATVAEADTVWVSVPASVLDGHENAIVGSSSAIRGWSPARTPWVDVRL